ncbi:fructosamine kinase family protein [Demequina soli]|uniref:fructosamine kinase family protein n=1 Tax=Demequina soli TaxID=1638987 RepID=UPI0007824F2F|nr:fructosamine kinase family protein [Demequina soli]
MTVTKADPAAPPGFFEAEAAGLRWLAEAGGAHVARVVDVAPGRIVLERIAHARPTPAAARTFGRDLARTHAAGAAAFGARPDGWAGPLFIGSREMPALTSPTWGAFYAEARVRPFIDPALAAGFLAPDEARIVHRACDAIADGAFDDDAPPARIHGDLWAGNVLFSPAGMVLIDPAAHGGHPETDLAMLALFGLPFLDDALAGYADEAPLRVGWRTRVPLHQLHPLAVHAAGHGRGYGVALADAAAAVLRLA